MLPYYREAFHILYLKLSVGSYYCVLQQHIICIAINLLGIKLKFICQIYKVYRNSRNLLWKNLHK